MKKLFTLIAATAMAMAAGAQSITFGEEALANAALPTVWENGGVKLVLTNDGKPSVDLNNATFGTAEENVKYSSRLKTGGKSSNARFLTLTVPADGTVKIAARTGKNEDKTRTLVLTQDNRELISKALDEEEAITTGESKIYPYVSADVKAGDIVITFPVNGINIYGILFTKTEPSTPTGISNIPAKDSSTAVYNMAGQRVGTAFKGVVIKNGKKIVQK